MVHNAGYHSVPFVSYSFASFTNLYRFFSYYFDQSIYRASSGETAVWNILKRLRAVFSNKREHVHECHFWSRRPNADTILSQYAETGLAESRLVDGHFVQRGDSYDANSRGAIRGNSLPLPISERYEKIQKRSIFTHIQLCIVVNYCTEVTRSMKVVSYRRCCKSLFGLLFSRTLETITKRLALWHRA